MLFRDEVRTKRLQHLEIIIHRNCHGEPGILRRSLETKPVKVPVEVKTQIVYWDGLVYKDCIETQTVEVERQLSWWQQTKMKLGIAFLALIVITLLYLFPKFSNLLTLKRL